jgi:hypothetical protein
MPRYLRLHVLSFALSIAIPGMLLAQQSEDSSTLGTFTTTDVPGATRSQARYLNSRGDIVGFYTAESNCVMRALRFCAHSWEIHVWKAPVRGRLRQKWPLFFNLILDHRRASLGHVKA